MDEIDAQIQAVQAELAALKAQPVAEEVPWYSPKQLAFDVPVGVAKAGAGLADILSYPVIKGAQLAGVSPETLPTFGMTKLIETGMQPVAEDIGVRPSTGTQELISFLSPSPLSKASVATQAGTGLASYLGMKSAERYGPESKYTGLVGALLGPGLATGAGKLAGAGIRAVSPAVGIAAGSDEALRAAAQAEVLRQAGPEGVERLRLIQEVPELATATGGVPLTAAEVVQTPTLAQYQQEIAKKAGATDILGAAKEARGVELQAALERLGITPEAGDFGIALRDAAEQAAKKQAASKGSILRSLGLTEEGKGTTKTERGATLREAISEKMNDANDLASEAWRAVPKETKLDASTTLEKILSDFRSFDELDRADAISDVPKLARVLNQTEKYLEQNNGIITVGQLQGLRRAAGRAMTEASGKNKTAGRLMGDFRENLETTGLKYFYDQTAGAPGGLPGTAATATDLNALQKLSTAIDKTREAKQIFNEGVVGEITALRRFKPKLKTSSVIDRALKNPENASEIIEKFGKDSVEATELRLEMLGRLDKATNPTEFLGRNKDTLRAIFGGDYAELNRFAQQKGRGTGLEQFERITDTQIPNKIFADVKQANAFMERFQGTELEQYARAKFIKTKLTKSGNAVANLDANKKIAQRLFGADYDNLQKVINDLELSKTPSELAKAASKGQSITSQSLTSLGAIAASRGVIGVMKQGALPSSIVGGFGGGWLGATAGLAAGAALRKTGQAREIKMDKFVAEILANPSLIKFAAAPPTEANIRKLIDIGQTLQRGGLAVGGAETPILSNTLEDNKAQYVSGQSLADALKAQVDKAPVLSEQSPNYVDDLKYDLPVLNDLYKQNNLGTLVINKTQGTQTFVPGYNAPIPPGLLKPEDEVEVKTNVQEIKGQEQKKDIDAAIEAVRRELESLRSAPVTEPTLQTESIKVGKQDVSIPVGEQYAPPKLVKAMIDVESSFDPKAVSPKKAKGLMQLMPSTASDLGLAEKDIFDPNKNVEAGSRYMRQQMDQIPDLQASIAAYNWGIGNVLAALDKAEAKGKPRTWASIRRSAPIETQRYVDKVLMKYRMLEA